MFCKRTKEFLSQQGIEFEERDVSQDEAALDELQQRGLMTTPVTLIDGEAVVWDLTERSWSSCSDLMRRQTANLARRLMSANHGCAGSQTPPVKRVA